MTRDEAALRLVSRFVAFARIGPRASAAIPGSVPDEHVWSRQLMSVDAMSAKGAAAWGSVHKNIDGFVDGNALHSDELMKRLVVQLIHSAELDQRYAIACGLNEDVVSSRLALASWCRPSAVAWLVSTIGVDAVKRMAVGSWSHVVAKCNEVVSPLSAHRDPSASVVRIALVVRVVTSGFRVVPRSIFGSGLAMASAPKRASVLDRLTSGYFSQQATTTKGAADPQSVTKYDSGVAAIASAEPFRMPAAMKRAFNYGQSAEAFASQVVKFHTAIMPYRVTTT